MNATKTFALHKAAMGLAHDSVARNIQEEDGEKCFNLPTFLDEVESRLDTVFCGNDSPTNNFVLDPRAVARYLWCCLALENGDNPDGHTFKAMPILD